MPTGDILLLVNSYCSTLLLKTLQIAKEFVNMIGYLAMFSTTNIEVFPTEKDNSTNSIDILMFSKYIELFFHFSSE